MLTPGMLDILTQFVEKYSAAEFQAAILEALTATPPLPLLQEWLVSLELRCRLDGLHHPGTVGQLTVYIEALRRATLEESPYVCRAHLDLALSELALYQMLQQMGGGLETAPHGARDQYRFN
jgi:hypothetical protein